MFDNKKAMALQNLAGATTFEKLTIAQMLERGKLIELLEAAPGHANNEVYSFAEIADYLLANGVAIPVSCEDCKYYKEGELLAPNKFCFRLKHPTENRQVGYNFCNDDYCSYGERKENDLSNTDR